MGSTPLFIGTRRNQATQFIPAYGTNPRVLWTPGSAGSEIYGLNFSSKDNGAQNIQLGIATPLTLQENMGVGAFVDNGVSADQITRTAGSFITDGWQVGQRLLVQGATTIGNDFEVILTGVSASALLLAAGGSTVIAAENLPAGAKLFRLSYFTYIAVPAGAGAPSVVAVSGLDVTQAPMLNAAPDRLLTLGPNDYLAAKLSAALTSGEIVDAIGFGGDY